MFISKPRIPGESRVFFSGGIMLKKISALSMVALLSASVYAAQPMNVVDKTDAIETTLYGQIQKGAIVDRVGQIELTLWGEEKNGDLNQEINRIYKAVEFNGEESTLRTTVDMLEWTYNGEISKGSMIERLDTLERGIFGRVSTKTIAARVKALEKAILGNDKKVVLQETTIPETQTFKITLDQDISSQDAKVGMKVPFTVAEDITEDNLLVVPQGTKGVATVTELKKARSFGRPAEMQMIFSGIHTVGETEFSAIQGKEAIARSEEEVAAAGASVAGVAILGPVGLVGGFFIKGKSIDYPAGQALYVQPTTTVETYGAGLSLVDHTSVNIEEVRPQVKEEEPKMNEAQTTEEVVAKEETKTPAPKSEEKKTLKEETKEKVQEEMKNDVKKEAPKMEKETPKEDMSDEDSDTEIPKEAVVVIKKK